MASGLLAIGGRAASDENLQQASFRPFADHRPKKRSRPPSVDQQTRIELRCAHAATPLAPPFAAPLLFKACSRAERIPAPASLATAEWA